MEKVENVKRQGFRSTDRLQELRCCSLKLLFSCELHSPPKNNVAEALSLSTLSARVECAGGSIARVWLVGITISV